MSLFETGRHEALTGTAWSEERARDAIARIVSDTNAAFDSERLWPIHPADVSPERPPDCLKMLYNGAAGVIWALHRLDELGIGPLAYNFLPVVRTLAERHRRDLEVHAAVRDYIGGERNAFLFGETGLHLLEWKLAPTAEIESKLHASIEDRIGDPRGVVWGAAGTMLAALFLLERTGDARWRDLYVRHFDALWSAMEYWQDLDCHLWTSNLYGVMEKRLGALHGFLANAFAMQRGGNLLPTERKAELERRISRTLLATAMPEGRFINWPASTQAPPKLFVQHCNGAPGVINMLGGFPQSAVLAVNDLLLLGCELVWRAGPLKKYPCLCHGTPGNGYCFLKLHAQTGDAEWLVRARRFAMHAIEQSEAQLAAHGSRKFSLWTGDLGLALYLADCLSGAALFPTLDNF